MRTKQLAAILSVILIGGPVVFVALQVVRTLDTLSVVERERDTWQRADEAILQLNLVPGATVVDLGSGAGYFALKMAPRVAPHGRVLAVDLRRQSLAFLWLRAMIGRHWTLHVIHSQVDNPTLPRGPVDAVLIANTYHELTSPEPILKTLFSSMRAGARLVVVDRGPREGSPPHSAVPGHHDITPEAVEREITRQSFQTVARTDRFIDRPGDEDLWWLIVFRKP